MIKYNRRCGRLYLHVKAKKQSTERVGIFNRLLHYTWNAVYFKSRIDRPHNPLHEFVERFFLGFPILNGLVDLNGSIHIRN